MLHPKLVGQTLGALELVRSGARSEGLVGSAIRGVEARGKNLLVHFEAPWSLHVHLKMNGQVRLYARAPERELPAVARSHAAVVLDTRDHRVVVYDAPIARLLRTRDLTRDFHLRGLGPDLLAPSFDASEALERLCARASQPLGEALMDQSVVAGIGNVWKSELCFNLKLDPFAPVSSHDEKELSALLALAQKQLVAAVHSPRRTLPDPFTPRANRQARLKPRQGEGPLSVYEREGKPCYDCGARVAMARQGELRRSTYYCPVCQPSRGAA